MTSGADSNNDYGAAGSACVHFGDTTTILADHETRGSRAAMALRERGVDSDAVVAILLRNDPAYLDVLTSIRCLDGYRVNLPWHLSASELHTLLAALQPDVLIGHADLLAGLGDVLAAYPGLQVVAVATPALVQSTYALSDAPPHLPPGTVHWSTLVDAVNEGLPIPPGAPKAIGITSGTTGEPKLIQWAGPQRWANWYRRRTADRPAIETSLVTAPLYHGGQYGVFCQAWRLRANLVILPKFDAHAFLAAVECHRVTHAYAVPTMFVRLLRLPAAERARFDTSSLNYVFHTGAPCPPAIKTQMLDWLGPVIWEAYGCSETSTIAVASSYDWLRRPGTVGQPVRPVRILDRDGHAVPAGMPGRIVVDTTGMPRPTVSGGPAVGEPHNTAWLDAGDTGYLDAEGYLYVLGRADELINTGRVKVYPREIENAILQHPAVADCAVRGIPDPEFGQVIAAVIQTVPQATLTAAALRQFLAQHLSEHKVPVQITIQEQALRSPAGKLDRQHLAAQSADGSSEDRQPRATPALG